MEPRSPSEISFRIVTNLVTVELFLHNFLFTLARKWRAVRPCTSKNIQ